MDVQDEQQQQQPDGANTTPPSGANSAGATSNSPPKKAKHRSCELCRALKIACVQSDVPGTCAKCLKHGKSCVVTERAPRTVKARKTSKTRVAEVERKLDGLVALLTAETSKLSTATAGRTNSSTDSIPQGHPFAPPQLSKTFSPERPPQPSPISRHESVASMPSCHGCDNISPGCSPSVSQDTNITSPCDSGSLNVDDIDVIGKGIVSMADARILLESYSDYQRRFPFVLVEPQHTVEFMRREKPLLLLAIFATVTYQDRPLQTRLESILRKAISERIFLRIERNIGLLQAMLVYLAFYHYHFKPHMQNLTQLLNAAMAMAMDLGYDRRPQRTPAQALAMHAGKPAMDPTERPDPEKTQDAVFWSHVARRAFLGVWWLSSTLSIAFRRMNLMQNHRPYVDKCSRSLFENPANPLDLLLDRLVRAQMIMEDIFVTFGYNDDEGVAPGSELQLQMNLRSFDGRIEMLRKDIVAENDPLDYSLRSARAYCYEVGMHLTPGGISGKPIATPSALQIQILCQCVQSIGSLLDSVLATPPFPNQVAYTIADWARVTYAVVVLSKLSLSYIDVVDASGTNVLAYMDALIDRGAQLNVSERKGVTEFEYHDVFFFLKWLFGNMRTWHELRRLRNDDGSGIALDACHCPGDPCAPAPNGPDAEVPPLQLLPEHDLQKQKEAEEKRQREEVAEKARKDLEEQARQQQMSYSQDNGTAGSGEELFGWMQWLPTLGLITEDQDMWGSIMAESFPMDTDGPEQPQVQV